MCSPDQIALLSRSIDRLSIAVCELLARKAIPIRMISASTFAKMLDVSESSILKGWKKGSFPPPSHKAFEGTKGWRWDINVVEMYIESITPEGRKNREKPEAPRMYESIRKRRVA